jgi:hypothetical protein
LWLALVLIFCTFPMVWNREVAMRLKSGDIR